MQSLRSRLFIGLLRNRHLLQGRWKPEVIDDSFSVEAFRNSVDEQSKKLKMPQGIRVESTSIGDMYAEWLVPEKEETENVLLYIHGGGFISGSCLTHRNHVAKFVQGSKTRALLFDYRLAPEHPYPAAVDDCIAAYRHLLNEYEAESIVICGESAGGTLTLATLVALRDLNLALPRASVSISPVTDLTCTAPSFTTNFKKDIAPLNSWSVWTQMYIADNDPRLPWLSPQMADLHQLPPMLLVVGSHEIHLDDTVNFARKAEKSGVQVRLIVSPGMVHAFPILAPLFPEATRAMAEICQFIRGGWPYS